jgi:hypothetical protein
VGVAEIGLKDLGACSSELTRSQSRRLPLSGHNSFRCFVSLRQYAIEFRLSVPVILRPLPQQRAAGFLGDELNLKFADDGFGKSRASSTNEGLPPTGAQCADDVGFAEGLP